MLSGAGWCSCTEVQWSTETELTGGIDCDSMQEVMAGSPPPDFVRCEFPRLY